MMIDDIFADMLRQMETYSYVWLSNILLIRSLNYLLNFISD